MPTRITSLTDAQRAQFDAHADKWIAIGLRTGPTDMESFERAARECYRFAGIPWPGVVVRATSPLALAIAAPAAAFVIELIEKLRNAKPASGGPARGLVNGAADDAVRGAVGGAVDGAVDGAVHGAVRGAVDGAVGGAVHGAVGGAVHVAVRGAVLQKEIRRAIGDLWYHYCGGQWWAAWQAWTSYFRDVCELELPGDLWARDRAYAAAQSAGWWWPFREFVMVADRPRELHLEQVAERGWGSHRLHCADGPAIRWADGWALHYWHGTAVPADLIERGWGPEQILAEPNAEIRRCAVERLGWDVFIQEAGLRAVSTAPDPGNPGAALALYDLPARMQVFGDERVRLLLCRNGSEERGGERRRFGLTCPADIGDALSAAAWGYRVTAEEYVQLARRT